MENKKSDPLFKLNEVELGKTVSIELKHAKPVKVGESKFGKWFLWIVSVDNVPVEDKETKKILTGYTGEALWFPSEELNKQLNELTKGVKEGVRIKVTPKALKGYKGLYTSYEVELDGGGNTPPENLSHSSHRFLEFYKKYLETYETLTEHNVLENNKESFIKLATSSTNNIPLETAEILWDVYNEKK